MNVDWKLVALMAIGAVLVAYGYVSVDTRFALFVFVGYGLLSVLAYEVLEAVGI